MPDEPKWFQPGYRPLELTPTPGEPLFEFVRPSDQALVSCDLRFRGEAYGWLISRTAMCASGRIQ